MMQSATHLAMGQWRDALEIRDPQSFGEYLRRQNDRVREFGEKVTGDSRRLIQMSQETSQQALRVGEESARNITRFAERGTQQAQRMAERGAEQARSTMEAAKPPAKAPISNYDELNASDIEHRAEKLEKAQLRQLLDYERSNKNRKTLVEALERRL